MDENNPEGLHILCSKRVHGAPPMAGLSAGRTHILVPPSAGQGRMEDADIPLEQSQNQVKSGECGWSTEESPRAL